ncbi:hypothetical protein SEMRO_1539_G280820.1 [Seminavis robusta]|uniref:Uncharacterized protein n=1 Tax=Seminavis robusta TaxID=568900 RepID=A0A9N8ETJ6_9STRA|nr:hypothetical protein SEMRO_1539_G280820.1 [Seminavis robusta]|eukprot:Sro1539_g280820.1 n/a (768) ;mRNA; f:3048-5666
MDGGRRKSQRIQKNGCKNLVTFPVNCPNPSCTHICISKSSLQRHANANPECCRLVSTNQWNILMSGNTAEGVSVCETALEGQVPVQPRDDCTGLAEANPDDDQESLDENINFDTNDIMDDTAIVDHLSFDPPPTFGPAYLQNMFGKEGSQSYNQDSYKLMSAERRSDLDLDLLEIMKDLPAVGYKRVRDWRYKSEHVYKHTMDHDSYTKKERTAVVQEIEADYNMDKCHPITKTVKLPHLGINVNLTVNSFAEQLMRLLSDPAMMDESKLLIDPKDPFKKSILGGDDGCLGEINTGSVFVDAHKRLCTEKNDILASIIFGMDKGGKLTLEPLMWTSSLFTRLPRIPDPYPQRGPLLQHFQVHLPHADIRGLREDDKYSIDSNCVYHEDGEGSGTQNRVHSFSTQVGMQAHYNSVVDRASKDLHSCRENVDTQLQDGISPAWITVTADAVYKSSPSSKKGKNIEAKIPDFLEGSITKTDMLNLIREKLLPCIESDSISVHVTFVKNELLPGVTIPFDAGTSVAGKGYYCITHTVEKPLSETGDGCDYKWGYGTLAEQNQRLIHVSRKRLNPDGKLSVCAYSIDLVSRPLAGVKNPNPEHTEKTNQEFYYFIVGQHKWGDLFIDTSRKDEKPSKAEREDWNSFLAGYGCDGEEVEEGETTQEEDSTREHTLEDDSDDGTDNDEENNTEGNGSDNSPGSSHGSTSQASQSLKTPASHSAGSFQSSRGSSGAHSRSSANASPVVATNFRISGPIILQSSGSESSSDEERSV